THLYFVSRTNWSSFDRYLSWLQSNNYVECKMDEEEKYQLTDTGREMFNLLLKFHEHVKISN
ncbi:MAG: winged helix-turn-helix domain-containing protein, partial [Nitrosopumilaceae archaeon]